MAGACPRCSRPGNDGPPSGGWWRSANDDPTFREQPPVVDVDDVVLVPPGVDNVPRPPASLAPHEDEVGARTVRSGGINNHVDGDVAIRGARRLLDKPLRMPSPMQMTSWTMRRAPVVNSAVQASRSRSSQWRAQRARRSWTARTVATCAPVVIGGKPWFDRVILNVGRPVPLTGTLHQAARRHLDGFGGCAAPRRVHDGLTALISEVGTSQRRLIWPASAPGRCTGSMTWGTRLGSWCRRC